MPIDVVRGDLFAEFDKLDAIGHGVNCQGVMGAGIAKQFRARWPEMYSYYRNRCLQGKLRPGQILPWRLTTGNKWIYNLATQRYTGACAKLEYVDQATRLMRQHAESMSVSSIGIPAIGCGIGGLRFSEVCEAIENQWRGTPLKLIVVVLPSERAV